MDLNMNLDEALEKLGKVAKKANKLTNGEEKQLVFEVGSHTTKVVEYIIKDKSIEVTGGALINTPANAIQNDKLVEIQLLANTIKQVLKEEKIKTKDFVISIASKEIIIRQMNAPKMQERELKSFIQLNSTDIFPVKLSNYILAYHIVEKGEPNKVMIAAIPKEIIVPYIKLADKLGLSLKGINYSGYELYNFLDYEIGTMQSSYLAFDVGAKSTNIIIISNGVLKFNKIIPKGSEETSKFISEELNCPLTRAEQLKRQYNTIEPVGNSEEENVVTKYTCRCVDNILQDIQRVIEFYNSNNPTNKVAKIYVLGVISKVEGIEGYISQKINVATKAMKFFSKVTFSKNALKLKSRQQNFLNCFGAYNLKDRKFYFMKDDLKFRKVSFILKPEFHKAVIAALLILIGVLIFRYNEFKEVENRKLFYENYIADNSVIDQLNKELENKEWEISDFTTSLDSLGVGLEKHIVSLEEVEFIVNNLQTDANVTITNYKYQTINSENSEDTGKFEIRIKIFLPEGMEQSDPKYVSYQNIPYNLQETIKNKLEKTVNIKSNTQRVDNIEFVLEIII